MEDINPFDHQEAKNPHDPYIGTIEHGGFIKDEIPPDIEEFIIENGFKEKKYRCSIKRCPQDGGSYKEFLPGDYTNCYPSIEDIGRKFGAGQYIYMFTYASNDYDPVKLKKSQKMKVSEYKVYLGSEWDDLCAQYQAEIYFKNKENLKKLKQKSQTKNYLDDETTKEDPIASMKQTMGLLKDLGVPIGGGNGGSDMNMTQMFMFMMQMQQKSSENMMQMMIASQQNTSNLMQSLISGRPQTTNTMDHFKEMMTMVQGITEVKEIMNPEKRTVVDRIFEMAEGVMPAIMQIASRPPEQRANDPMVGMVKNMGEFKEIDQDPEMRAELIKKWDEAHGEANTDAIIATVGWEREAE